MRTRGGLPLTVELSAGNRLGFRPVSERENSLQERNGLYTCWNRGDILDHVYQIVGEIGAGGTGIISKAYHLRLKRYVVVKKIKDEVAARVHARAEADILKRLKHTYLPQVYDFLEIDGGIYTVIDFIEGQSLDYYIKNGYKIQQRQLIIWARQLCEALAYLHAQAPPIIHSDIKPQNIMITTQGNVCLIDFNISLDGQGSSQISGLSAKLCTSGAIFKP